MKTRAFYWGWKNYDRQPDRLMTADRMVKLLRAWRRGRDNYGRIVNKVSRLAPGVYCVTHQPTGETATFSISREVTPCHAK